MPEMTNGGTLSTSRSRRGRTAANRSNRAPRNRSTIASATGGLGTQHGVITGLDASTMNFFGGVQQAYGAFGVDAKAHIKKLLGW
jgi:hypothetical protein